MKLRKSLVWNFLALSLALILAATISLKLHEEQEIKDRVGIPRHEILYGRVSCSKEGQHSIVLEETGAVTNRLGFAPNDIILGYNGQSLESREDFYVKLILDSFDEKIEITLLRAGNPHRLMLTPEQVKLAYKEADEYL